MDPKRKEAHRAKGKGKGQKKDFRTPRGPKDKYGKEYKEDKPYIGPNDIKWRTNDEVMTKLVAKLPFGLAAGLSQSVRNNLSANAKFKQPGVMAIEIFLTAGASQDYNSAVNLCARKIYSYVRHANSGSKNYEAADLMIYFISIAQALGMLGFLQRVLTVLNSFSPTNRYTPRCLLNSMRIDADDLLDHQPEFKYLIAWMGRAIGSLAFPDIPYFHACYEAFKYIYVDNDSPKEQYYLYIPRKWGVYNPTLTANGGGVDYTTSWPGAFDTLLTFSSIKTICKSMMDVLLGDEDCGIMSGDILKAFKDGGLFTPAAFGDDYDVFQYSREALQQIHNVVPHVWADYRFNGYIQNPGATNTAPYVVADYGTESAVTGFQSGALCEFTIIDAFSRDPDPEEVVNCLVLSPQIKPKAIGSGYCLDMTTAAFDLFLPTGVIVYSDISSTTGTDLTAQVSRTKSLTTAIPPTSADVTNFDWHPMIIKKDASDNIRIYGDIQNLRIFEHEVGVHVHENSMLSLFNFKELNFVTK